MWAGNSGSWPQGQWPLQQSAYQNIPHEQVDWAALAQQWIQMKEAMNDNCEPPQVSPNISGPPRPPQFANRPLLPRPMGDNFAPPNTDKSLPTNSMGAGLEPNEKPSDNGGNFDHLDNNWNSGSSGYWQSSWNSAPATNWAPPNPPDNREPPFEFGRNHGNQGYGVQTYNYNHGSDQFYFNQTGEQSSFNQYWTGSNSANPAFVRGIPKDRQLRGDSPVAVEEDVTAPFNLDAVKCKNLPAWIREGLEKMDRDKQKKLDRERMLQEREERLRRQQEEEEQVLREMQAAKSSIYPARKSKFESDSEEDDDESPNVRTRSPSLRRSVSPFQRKTPSPVMPLKTEQEKLEDMMVKVRRMLTEILLEVTNEEISIIAKDTFNRERIKAPAQQLAKSSALASITGNLGLGDYGTDSEASEDEHEKGQDSDVELQGTVQRRKAEFAEREKQIVAAFKNELTDDEKDAEDEGKKVVRGGAGTDRSKQVDAGSNFITTSQKYFDKNTPCLGGDEESSSRDNTSKLINPSEEYKSSATESTRSTRSPSNSDSDHSSHYPKKLIRSVSKDKRSKSRSKSQSPVKNRRDNGGGRDDKGNNSKRSRYELESVSKSSREKERRKRSRSSSREKRYRRTSESRSSRKSRSRSRGRDNNNRRRSSYGSSRRKRSRSRSRSYERSRYHRREPRKRSRSRSSSERSDRSRSRERRNSRHSYSRSPNTKSNWDASARAASSTTKMSRQLRIDV